MGRDLNRLLLELLARNWRLHIVEGFGVLRSRSGYMWFRIGIYSGRRVVPRGPGAAEVPGWTLRVMDLSGEALGSLDTCHYRDVGQILTTTVVFIVLTLPCDMGF